MTEVPFAFATTAVKQNYALKAKWELKKLTVVVTDAPNADAPHTNEEIFRKNDVPYGGTTAEPTRPENKTGYHFDRWLDHANNPYDFTQPVTKNETVHASYAPNAYKVRYNANAADASGSMTDSDHVYDTAKNLRVTHSRVRVMSSAVGTPRQTAAAPTIRMRRVSSTSRRRTTQS